MAGLDTVWVDSIGMHEDAEWLNAVQAMLASHTAAIAANAVGIAADTRGAASPYIATTEVVTIGSYADCATVTDHVSLTVGASRTALVIITAALGGATVNGTNLRVGFALSGANTLAASDAFSLTTPNTDATQKTQQFLLTPVQLTATGITDFKLKMKGDGGVISVKNRSITVIAFP